MAKAAKLLAGLQDQSGFGFVIRRTHTNTNTQWKRLRQSSRTLC